MGQYDDALLFANSGCKLHCRCCRFLCVCVFVVDWLIFAGLKLMAYLSIISLSVWNTHERARLGAFASKLKLLLETYWIFAGKIVAYKHKTAHTHTHTHKLTTFVNCKNSLFFFHLICTRNFINFGLICLQEFAESCESQNTANIFQDNSIVGIINIIITIIIIIVMLLLSSNLPIWVESSCINSTTKINNLGPIQLSSFYLCIAKLNLVCVNLQPNNFHWIALDCI